MCNKMKSTVLMWILVFVISEIREGGTAIKPKLTNKYPTIAEGEKLVIECKGASRLSFSVQKLTGMVNQSEHVISEPSETDKYTITIQKTRKEDTGWYGCAEDGIKIVNDEQIINHTDPEISWTHVYVNSSEPFAVMNVNANVSAVAGRRVVIPCRPTTESQSVILKVIFPDNGTVPEKLYDPKIGFIIKKVNYIHNKTTFMCGLEGSEENDKWPKYTLEVLDPEPLKKPEIAQGDVVDAIRGTNLTLACEITVPDGDDIDIHWKQPSSAQRIMNSTSTTTRVSDKKDYSPVQWRSELKMNKVGRTDGGIYTCHAEGFNENASSSVQVNIQELRKIIGGVVKVNLSQPATLSCDVEGYDLSGFKWTKINASKNGTDLKNRDSHFNITESHVKMYLNLTSVTREDNGTYECRAMDDVGQMKNHTFLIVTEKPEVKITELMPVGTDKVYLEWEIDNGNDPVEPFYVKRRKNGTDQWEDSSNLLNEDTPGYVVKKLEKGTAYWFSIRVRNSIGFSPPANSLWVKTFEKDPKFVPEVNFEQWNATTVTVSWSFPSESKLQNYYNKYRVNATYEEKVNRSVIIHTPQKNYTFNDLEAGIQYTFTVEACNKQTNECSQSGTTESGVSGIVAYAGFGVAFIVFLTMGAVLCIWKSRDRRSRQRFMEATLVRFRIGALQSLDPKRNVADQAELLPYDKKWEYPKKQLKLGKELGRGAFGIVKKGRAVSILKKNLVTTVAVKMVRATFTLDHMTALTRELKILAHLGKHLNIVNLLGACTKNMSYGELFVIVEFCRFGNIRDYILCRRDDFLLRVDAAAGNTTASTFDVDYIVANDSGINTMSYDSDSTASSCGDGTVSIEMGKINDAVDPIVLEPGQSARYVGDFTDRDLKPITTRDLLSWAWQVSRGMKYLSSRRVIHADLAARNILLAHNNVVKICDFGLAKSLYESDTYKKEGHGPLPVKWMAVESIRDRVFSVKSDVWSFGVVLWEFFSLAETPYPGIENDSVYQKLIDGFRMELPKLASEDMYKMMLNCWDADPSKRPSFAELEESLEGLLDDNVKSDYIKFDAPYAELNAKELAEGKPDYFAMEPSQSTLGSTKSEKD